MHLLDPRRGIDDDAAPLIALGDGEEAGAEGLVEGLALALEAVLPRPAALTGTTEAGGRRQVEDEGEVGREIVGDEPVELSQPARLDTAGEPLSLSAWFVEPGESVEAGEPLFEVALPGITCDVAAPVSGRVSRLVKS